MKESTLFVTGKEHRRRFDQKELQCLIYSPQLLYRRQRKVRWESEFNDFTVLLRNLSQNLLLVSIRSTDWD
jgi:hypothetical protein